VESVLAQTYPIARELPETPSEDTLRSLYPHAPGMIRLGMISGTNGESAGLDGSSRSLQGHDDLRVLRVLRAAADVVVVGGETARRERYGPIRLRDALAATRSSDQAPNPIVAIVTLTGSVPDGLNPTNSLLVTTHSAPAVSLADQWGKSMVLAGDSLPSPEYMTVAFADRGLSRILCEGGPSLWRWFLDAGVVTDLCMTTSPRLGGRGARHVPSVPENLQHFHTLESQGFVMRRWGVRD
jgi:riboflavin biosynthesis pyrimidine reductase